MKKVMLVALSIVIALAGIFMLLNINVGTKQCIDYDCRSIRIPLYLKVLDFFDRHYNYKELVKRIIKDAKSEQEKAIKIFQWTHENIRKVPDNFPVMDDHIWYTIVRGYGKDDQSCDVFSALCNYAGLDAFYFFVYPAPRQGKRIALSFVKIGTKWLVFDPYRGAYFRDRAGNLADIEVLKSSSWTAESNAQGLAVDYKAYFNNLPVSISAAGLKRVNAQSPFKRLLFAIKKFSGRSK